MTRWGRLNWLQQDWVSGQDWRRPTPRADVLQSERWTVDAPLTVVLERVAELVRSHESLRTRLIFDSPSGSGVQLVDPAPSRLTDLVDRGIVVLDPASSGSDGRAETRDRGFLLSQEWPIRVFLHTRSGLVEAAQFEIDHSACDAWGFRLARRLLQGRGDHPTLENSVSQPLDVVGVEDEMTRRIGKSPHVAMWHEAARRTQPQQLNLNATRGANGVTYALDSTVLPVLAHKLALTHRVPLGSVYLWLFAASASTTFELDTFGAIDMWANRRSRPERESVSLRFTSFPLFINVQSSPQESIRELSRSRLRAQTSVHADPKLIGPDVEETRTLPYFNFVKQSDRWNSPPNEPSFGEPTWKVRHLTHPHGAMLRIRETEESATFEFTACADSDYAHGAQETLQTMHDIAARAARAA